MTIMRSKKKWGQNFLIDPNICKKIVSAHNGSLLLDSGDLLTTFKIEIPFENTKLVL